ncbi:hypothetical protein [Nocardia wallacei]|uniref:hypothetical protein n=1 Tax=Nocardia wallacei TaxID=480035 RepID=UPI0024574633|nr:hypothetical protein [Nocardia wallacei]
MPFTSCYGHEYEVVWPVSGPGDQFLQLFIMPNWSIVGPNFTNTLGVRLMHQTVGASDSVRIQQWASLTSLSSDVATASPPVPLNGSVPLTLKVWVEDDQFVGVWVNGTYTVGGVLNSAFRTGPGRRGMNLMQFSVATAKYQWADVYDRKPSCPGDEHWSPLFTDDFERPDGAVGNGWTQFGTSASIVSGWWTTTGTTDGNRAIVRDSGIASGFQRVSGVIRNPNNTADCSLLLRVNAAGTQALGCNVFGNKLYISRMSGSLTSPTWNDFSNTSLTVNDGDTVTFSAWDDWAWVEINGVRRAYAPTVTGVVPTTNSWVGARVSRSAFNNSGAWDEVRIYSGV